MLSSCKNTAWEKSKCLRHLQLRAHGPAPLPAPAMPSSKQGPGWELSKDPPTPPQPGWQRCAGARHCCSRCPLGPQGGSRAGDGHCQSVPGT